MGIKGDMSDLVAPGRQIRTLLLTRDGIRALTLDVRSGVRHKLDPAAASVWALLDRPMPPRELTSELMSMFEIAPDVAADAVDTALHAFRGMGLLEEGVVPQDWSTTSHTGAGVRALPRDHDP